MTFVNELDKSIKKGMNFLESRQLSDGDFICYFSNNPLIQKTDAAEPGWYFQDSIIFATILIGNSLLFLTEAKKVDGILLKLTKFLVNEKKFGSIWNHFTQKHKLFSICPFDVDDTACASALLKARNVDFPSNRDLLLSHKNDKGLFYTFFTLRSRFVGNWQYWRIALTELKHPFHSFVFWRKTEASRNDIDAIVNANVLYYLGESEQTRDVIILLNDIIINHQESKCDKWYINPFTAYYFISRNYYIGMHSLQPACTAIKERILQKLSDNGCIGGTVLNTALAICTLQNLSFTNTELTKSVNYLIANQNIDGSWERRIFYTGGPLDRAGWGSEELTTGFCLEALARYQEALN